MLGIGLIALGAAGLYRFYRAENPGPGPRPASFGGTTAEGFPIADAQTTPTVKGQRIDGDANTLLFTFGLRFGQDTYTYQAAVDFTGGDGAGAGLIKAFKGGQEASSGALPVKRVVEDDGYLGFVMVGPLAGAVKAPAVCVAAKVGKTPSRFDLGNGGGLFCAFGTNATGLCDADVKIGCGNLVP